MRRDWTGCCRRGALGPGSAAGPISDDAFGDDGTMSKVAVVTGSTKGLGRGLATELLARGHRVAIVSPNGEDSASAARALGAGAAGFGCDVTDLAQVQALWDRAAARVDTGRAACRARGCQTG